MNERDVVIDIDGCEDTTTEKGRPNLSDDKVGNGVSLTVSVNELAKGENSIILSSSVKNVGRDSPGKDNKKEKRMSMSAKKPPKPPRPPRGLSLDAADQKLIKEISELAMIKRARIERMKALKKMKAAKTSSASASSTGNFIAMFFTILFCVVIIFQGCHPWGVLARNRSATGMPGSPKLHGETEDKFVMVRRQWNLPTSTVPLSGAGSPNLMELIPGSDNVDEGKRDSN